MAEERDQPALGGRCSGSAPTAFRGPSANSDCRRGGIAARRCG